MSAIPGTTACHAYITDACRQNRTDEAAVDHALKLLRGEALACLRGWKQGSGAQFHLVLTVERPQEPTVMVEGEGGTGMMSSAGRPRWLGGDP